MDHTDETHCTAFAGMRRITSGTLTEVALAARDAFGRDPNCSILIFDDTTSEQIDLDLSAAPADLGARLSRAEAATPPDEVTAGTVPRGPGRPRLGVVAREVTLLPRHWEWLNEQPGGASVALRKLVEVARKANEGRDRQRRAQEAAYRFMSALAGNLPGFEDAIRALFAGDRPRFDEMVEPWPPDVRDHASRLAAGAFAEGVV
ncbi:MAG TPA: DUF2239 family protein [Thermoanaerobaculaceae bacterium]|nr:DUF2239 family protein [Thermoanaerobaculaceae bacterium]